MYQRGYIIILICLAIVLGNERAFAQGPYTSPNHTLQNAKVVIAGGTAISLNYSLNNVKIGNIFGGKSQSPNYSLDGSRSLRRIPPNPPALNPIVSPTNVSFQTLSGRKDALTSIYINGYEAVPLNGQTTWSCNVNLVEGDNMLLITARNIFGLDSEPVNVNIILDTAPPIIVITSPITSPIMVYEDKISVEGTIDGVSFIEERSLNFGPNVLTLTASDTAGNISIKDVEVYRVREPLALP